MTTVKHIMDTLEQYAPVVLAEEWDHVGLMVGDRTKPVSKVLLALDVTQAVAEEAVELGCEMIISHHPFLFHPLYAVDLNTAKGRTVAYLLQHGITVYSAHTNLDYAVQGVNDSLRMMVDYASKGGTVDMLTFAQNLKKALHAPVVKIYGPQQKFHEPVGKVVVSCGAFDGDFSKIKEANANVLVTGEMKYNQAVDLMEQGVCVVEAGHYDTEKIVLPRLQSYLQEKYPAVAFHLTTTSFPVSIVL